MSFLYKLHPIYIILVGFIIPFDLLAENQNSKSPLGGFEVRVIKKTQKHIHTAALLCALYQEEKVNNRHIQSAWVEKFQDPITTDDQFLVTNIMQEMCPKITPTKPSSN